MNRPDGNSSPIHRVRYNGSIGSDSQRGEGNDGVGLLCVAGQYTFFTCSIILDHMTKNNERKDLPSPDDIRKALIESTKLVADSAKFVATLSAGAVLLIPTFLSDFVSDIGEQHFLIILVVAAILAFGASLLSSLIVLVRTSQVQHLYWWDQRNHFNQTPEKGEGESKTAPSDMYEWWKSTFRRPVVIQMLFFALGVIIFGAAAVFNLLSIAVYY